MGTFNSPIGDSWENGYECPYCGLSYGRKYFKKHTQICKEEKQEE